MVQVEVDVVVCVPGGFGA